MTVYDFLENAVNEELYIMIYNFSNDCEEIMTIDEAKYAYGDCELTSFDFNIYNNTLCVNINEDF